MSEIQIIESALKEAARRHRFQRALNGLVFGILAGAAVMFLALTAYKLLPLSAIVLSAAGVAAGCLAVGGLLWGGWRKMNLLETARWVDEKRNLKERLSTVLELKAAQVT